MFWSLGTRTIRGGYPLVIVQFAECRIELVQGDITHERVDAIVNAANAQLAGGGGVDGAIHRAGGPILKQQTEVRYPEGCATGDAVVTDAGNLQAKFVFHAVGPIWSGGVRDERKLLAAVYRTCLEQAIAHACDSIAFPAISTGVYRFPVDQAAEISLKTAADFVVENNKPQRIRFVLFDGGTYGAYARVLESMAE